MKLLIGVLMGLLETVVISCVWKRWKLIISKKKTILAGTAFFSVLLFVLLFQKEYSIIEYINTITVYAILYILAGIDYQLRMIPNKILIVGMGIRTVLYFVEAVSSFDTIKDSSLSAMTGFGFGLFFLLLLSFVTKKGIGYGDVKLFAWLGYSMGIRDVYSILFYSAIAAAVVGTYLILVKKADKKREIPFAPAVLAGTYFVFFMSFIK